METYQIINLADWQQMGEGGNGKTYVNHNGSPAKFRV